MLMILMLNSTADAGVYDTVADADNDVTDADNIDDEDTHDDADDDDIEGESLNHRVGPTKAH